jgi:hypothetical protein
MLKIYLAARYSRRNEMKKYREILTKNYNATVTSHWLDEKSDVTGGIGDEPDEFYWETAQIDFMDIEEAHVLVLFSEDPLIGVPRGGRNVEFGYALKCGKPIWVVGPKENVFHYRPRVEHFNTFDELLAKKFTGKKQ